jgi:hypothetical protein
MEEILCRDFIFYFLLYSLYMMKTIELLVKIEVPDDYVMDEPEWLLEDSVRDCSISSVTVFENNHD